MHGRALPLLCLLLAMASSAVQANDDDTRRLLNQIDRNLNERERSHLVEETPPDVDPSALITINGTTYSVDATLTDLEPAIYVAINLQQWAKVDQFVEKYQDLPGHNPALVLMAQGMVARSKDNHSLAIPEQPLEIQRTIHSFDPCIACAVHVMDPNGEELMKVKVT